MVVAERREILRGERIIEKRDTPHATSHELRIKSNVIRELLSELLLELLSENYYQRIIENY